MDNNIWDNLEEVKEPEKFNINNNSLQKNESIWDNLEEVKIDDNQNTNTNNSEYLYGNDNDYSDKSFSERHPFISSIPSKIGNAFNNTTNAIKTGLENTGKSLSENVPYTINNGVIETGIEENVKPKSFLNDQRYWLKTKANNLGDKLLRTAANMGNSNPYGNLQLDKTPVNTSINSKGQQVIDYSKESPMELKIAGSRNDYETLKEIRRNPQSFNTPEKQENANRVLKENYDRTVNNLNFGLKVMDAAFWGAFTLNLLSLGTLSVPMLGSKVAINKVKNELKKSYMETAIKRGVEKELAESFFNRAAEQGIIDKGIHNSLGQYSANILKNHYGMGLLNPAIGNLAGRGIESAAISTPAAMLDMGLLGTGVNSYTNYLGLTDNNPIEGGIEAAGAVVPFAATMGAAGGVLPYAINGLKRMPLKTTFEPLKNEVVPYQENPNIRYNLNGEGTGFFTTNPNIEDIAPNTVNKQRNSKKNTKLLTDNIEEPKTVAEIIAPNTTAKQNMGGSHIKEFNSGDIVKDIYTGEVLEVLEPDKKGMGRLRNVDDDTISTINAHNNAHYTKYEHSEDDLIKVEPFKYDDKKSGIQNQQNYMYSKEDVVNAYNEYIKNPTTENREKYQDLAGKANEEYSQIEPMLKDAGSVLPATENKPQKITAQGNKNNKIKTHKTDSIFETDNFYTNGTFIVKKDNFKLDKEDFITREFNNENAQKLWDAYANTETSEKLVPTGKMWDGKQLKAIEYEYKDENGDVKKLYLPKNDSELFKGYDLYVSKNKGSNYNSKFNIVLAKDNDNTVGFVSELSDNVVKNINNTQENFVDLNEQKQKIQSEKESKKQEISGRPTIVYKNRKDKKGNLIGEQYIETEKYHSDGNSAFLKDKVYNDISKVEVYGNYENAENQLEQMFNGAKNYTTKLEDLGKLAIGDTKKGKKIRVFEYDYDGTKKRVYINDKYLLDKKNIELYSNGDKSGNVSVISLRKDGEQIGVVMPIVFNKNENPTLVDVPKMKQTKPLEKVEPAHEGNPVTSSQTYDKENNTITTLKIEKDSIPNFDSTKELKQWIADKIGLLGDITIKSNNKTIQLSKSNLSRSMKGVQRSEVKRNSYNKLRELVENSIYGDTKPVDVKHSKKVKEQELYYNAFNYNGENYGIEISIDIPTNENKKKYNTPNTYAGHKIKIIKAPTATGADLKGTPNRLGADTISINYIKELFKGSVTEDKVEKGANIIYNDNKEVVEDEQSGQNEGIRGKIETSEINGRNDVDNGRGNESGLVPAGRGRGRINPEHQELLSKEYKNQHELNKSIEEFINNKEYEKYDTLPDEIKEYLKKYSGAGGLEKQGAEGKGLLSEYYTPHNIVKKMWDITSQYINTDGAKVLEPSVGVGRFLEHAPENTSFDVVEMNPVSAKITELLYPDANVQVGQFQERFIDKSKNLPVKSVTPEYDIVIGNPPYGDYSGLYKGMGEGKKYSRIEAYFINRGLDSLKDNGILTYIVPSSFLDSSSGKLEIANKAKLLDAYRLPENMFDTTSVGTDILVMRKDTSTTDLNFSAGNWFKKHPEKILGNVEERKNRFGKMEKYVNGDKNAIDNIDTSSKDIKETTVSDKSSIKNIAPNIVKKQAKGKTPHPNPLPQVAREIKYEEYKPEITVSEEDYKYFEDTQVDGTLPKTKYKPSEKVNQYSGELYNDFNYLQGDIYKKLDALKSENITDTQRELQRKKLESVLPEPKTSENINYEPTSDFIRDFKADLGEKEEYIPGLGWTKQKKTLADAYMDYARSLSKIERGEVSVYDIQKYINGERITFKRDIRVPNNIVGEQEIKKYKDVENRRLLSLLQNTVNKTFNNFVKDKLDENTRKELEKRYNRTFNNIYNPDYSKIPMIVKGLNSQFNGKKLELQNVQIEGVNFLTNKGAGLLGFEVGVGKTLTGIISTVQNMQMGRCKRPLILVPKQVKDNWIKEIHEAFPNIKVNDVNNLSKFKGEIEDGSLTVATYEALSNMWYDKGSELELTKAIYDASIKEKPNATERAREKTKEQVKSVLGKALGGNKQLHTVQSLGFDHITVDEAHNFKNLFEKAQSFNDDANHYSDIQGGSQSTRACRLFLLTQHIMNNNNNRNVFLLTATPFNNNALEVFNMLSYTAKDILDAKGLSNIYEFMENFAQTDSQWVVDSNNNVVYKQIVTGFKNAGALKDIINSTMLIRSAEDAGIVRPNKHVERVYLDPTRSQEAAIAKAEELAVANKDDGDVLRAIGQSRSATLSPDIAANNLDVTPEDFVKNSPKIEYCLKAIESMHKKAPRTSQILYMPLGVKFLPKMKEYLVNKGVFKKNEIAIIDSSVNDDKITDIVESFNKPESELKLIIGTKKIREGMNLNKNSSVLYVPYLDWNPTDFQQVVGRIWRRGNRYGDIRVVVPTLNNSSDSFMFQKNQEKSERINSLLSNEKADYIDLGELNTIEDKINMITNPQKKAKMFVQYEAQKINSEIASLEGKIESTREFKNKLEQAENQVKYLENDKDFEYYSNRLKEVEKGSEEYDRINKYVKDKKEELKNAKFDLKTIQNRIKRLELDLDGRDSVENLTKRIEGKKIEKENLKEIEEKKYLEYKAQYDKDQMAKKTIDELIKDFDIRTDELYKGSTEKGGELYLFGGKKINNELKDLHSILKRPVRLDNLIKYDQGFEILKDKFEKFKEYKIVADNSLNGRGTHKSKIKTIKVNMTKISDVQELTEVLAHELEHAEQYRKYLKALGKPDYLRTSQEKFDIKAWENCIFANKRLQRICKRDTELVEEYFDKKAQGYLENELDDYFNNTDKKEFYKVFKNAYNEYKNDYLEKQSENAAKNIRGVINNARQEGKFNGTRFERRSEIRSSYNVSGSRSGLEQEEGPFSIYDESGINREKIEQKVRDFDINDVDEILEKVKKEPDEIVKNIFTPISSRLDEISPSLKHAIRKFELNSALAENKSAEIVKPFIEKVSKMDKIDYAKYDLALKNGNKEIVDKINKKYGIENEYTSIKKLLSDIRKEAINVGLDVGEIEEYYPRRVINPSALLDEYSKSSFIKKYLKEIDPQNKLSADEKIEKINIALKGHNGAINATSSFVKGRKIAEIDKNLNRYYKDSKDALVEYITSMNNAIQTRKFFGNSEETLENSIGAFTNDLINNGIIKPTDEVKLKKLLTARFNQRSMHGGIRTIKNISYITTMGNPLSAVTQLGDFAFSLYKNGIFNTITGLKNSIFKTNRITKKDLGIERIAQEFENDCKSGKIVDKVFKLVGLNKIDALGKESFINGAMERNKKSAINALNNKNSKEAKEYYNYLHKIFGNETYNVLEDLSNEKLSENVKYLLFSEISDFQPISLSEMPEAYLKSGNGRIFYMLKTYSIKLLDVFRNEAYRQFKAGKHKKSIINFIRLGFYLTLMGVTSDKIKDWMLGRESSIGDTITDNILKMAMFSKYQLDRSKTEGIGKTALSNILFPTGLIDDISKDIQSVAKDNYNVKDFKTFRNIPVVGKMYYWWFGGGVDVKDKEFMANRKKEYKKYLETGDIEIDRKVGRKIFKKGYTNQETKDILKKFETGWKASNTKKYKEQFVEAIEKNDREKVQKIKKKIRKNHLPAEERRRIFENAYESYLSSLNN